MKVVLSALFHVDRRELTEPASGYFTLLFGGCQVKLLDNVYIVDVLLANFFDGVVDPISNLCILTFFNSPE